MQEIKIDKIVRSKRRTLALIVTRDAQLVVRAPFAVREDTIRNFVRKKSSWIKNKKELVRKQNEKFMPKKFVNGEGFLYLGRSYRFKVIDSKNIILTDFLEFPRSLLPQAKMHLIDWYKVQALKKISERNQWHAKVIGIKSPPVKITNAQKRWGSCGSKDMLNFSWRLIMAPLRVVDYVVIHELMHLEEKNHSGTFWRKVSLLIPGYESCKYWLKENGHLLNI